VGKRVFSSTLLWAIVIATMYYLKNTGAIILGTLVSMLTLREFYRLIRACGFTPFEKLGTVCGGIITLGPVLELKFGFPSHLLLPFAAIVFSIRLLGERTPENRMESLCSTLFGLVYVSLLLQYFIRLVLPVPNDPISQDGRLMLCLWLIAATKFCDMGGLLTGLAIGRHKMSPQISPKKTWEGAVGGVLASIIDSVCACAAIAHTHPDAYATTINLQVAFTKAVSMGRIRAVGKCIRAGQRILFCEAQVWNEDDELVGSGSSQLLRIPYPKEE
jgi:phosphatidate cytidylyltransferase